VLGEILFCECVQGFVVLLHVLQVVGDAFLGLLEIVACFEFTVHHSELGAVSVFSQFRVEFAQVLLKFGDFTDCDLLVICERFGHVSLLVAVLADIQKVRCPHAFKGLGELVVERVL